MSSGGRERGVERESMQREVAVQVLKDPAGDEWVSWERWSCRDLVMIVVDR